MIAPLPLRFQVGARTLATVHRQLARVAWSLDDVLAERALPLPPVDGDGYLLTSVPAALVADIAPAGLLAVVRQRYARFHIDLTCAEERWTAGLSSNGRATIRRKTRKVEDLSGGRLDLRRYRTPAEVVMFHSLAQPLSALTYQARLLDAGLPAEPDGLARLAADDRLRAWLLVVSGRPAAYLCCTADGDVIRYEHVGHDPAFAALSPGTVLLAAAVRELFADRFALFDFTEGEGQHKRLLATGRSACADLLLLRPTWRNHAVAAALTRFDRTVARAKRAAQGRLLRRLANRVRR